MNFVPEGHDIGRIEKHYVGFADKVELKNILILFYWRKGLDDLAAQLNEILTALPDLRVTADFMVAEEDKVVIYLTMTGTNSGPFGNIPPTNKPVKFNGVDIVRVKDGKASERWGLTDDFTMMTQMGLIETDVIFQQR
jgi:predicted ester cyclase